MAAYAQTAHRYRETAVGHAAPRHCRRLVLTAVHIQGYNLRAGALHGVGNDRAFRRSVAAGADAAAQAVAALQAQVHHLHVYIRLLRLDLARRRVGGRRFHIDVGRAHLQVFAHIQRVGALADLFEGLVVGLYRAAKHTDLHGGFLAGGLACVVTTHILVVITPCQHTVPAFLDDALAHACAQHDFGGLRFSAATATAGCQRKLGNGRAALVLQRHRLGAVVTFLHVAVKQGRALYLVELAGYGLVLHGIGALGIEARVNSHLVHRQVYVALCVGGLLLTVQRHALHRAATAEVVPAALALPTVQAGTDKLLRLPLALAHLEGHTRAFHALLLLHGSDGGGKGVKAVVQRIGLGHVDGVTAAGAAGFHKGILFIAPDVEGVAQQVEFVLERVVVAVGIHADLREDAVVHVVFCHVEHLASLVIPYREVLCLGQFAVTFYFSQVTDAVETGCSTVPGQHCHVLILFHHGFGCLRGLLRRYFRIRGRLCRCLRRQCLCIGIAGCGVGGTGCSFCRCLRCHCLRCCISRRLAQQTDRGNDKCRPAHGRQRVDAVKRRHLLQFRHVLALGFNLRDYLLLDFLFLLLCHS